MNSILINKVNAAEDIAFWAERTIKDQAFGQSKSMQKKRNTFSFSSYAVATRYFGITELELDQAIADYIAANPMKYYPTSKKLVYVAKAGN